MFNTEPFTIAPPMQVLLNNKVYVPFADEARNLLIVNVLFAAPFQATCSLLPLELEIVSKRKAPAVLSARALIYMSFN